MPPGGAANNGKETTDVPDDTAIDDTATEEAQTEQSAGDTVEEADEAVETVDEAVETVDDSGESTEDDDASAPDVEAEPDVAKRKIDWSRVVAYGLLPGLALLLAMGAGFSKWEDNSSSYGELPPVASEQHPSPALASVNAAKDSTIKMLSYKPDTVEQQLNAARDLLTGQFRDSYTSLINDVVIPGAKQKAISAVASVPAAASVSADPNHAVVLVFVNQTVVVGQDAPTDTASSVRVTLDRVGDRWLISQFDPV